MIKLRSLNDFLQSLRDFANANYPEIDTGEGSVVADLIFKVNSYAGKIFLEELVRVSYFFDLYKLSGTDLEYEASKYGIERSDGEKAKGKVVFYTILTPPANGIEIPVGTRVSGISVDGDTLIYQTLKTVYILPSDYYADTGRYEKEVEVEALSPGSRYNVGAGVVNVLIDNIPNVTGVINRDIISGGSDKETDDELRERIIKAILGRDIGTKSGYELHVEKAYNLIDSKIIAPFDEDYERLDGVDIFVVSSDFTTASESFVYDSGLNPLQEFILSNQPVKDIDFVQVNGTLLPDTDYSLVKDTGVYAESIRAKDKVVISVPLTNGDQVDIGYTYYNKISEIQSFVNRPENLIPGTGFLVKRAKRFLVYIEADVGFFANVDIASVKTDISNALTGYLNTKDLGEALDRSDVISVIQNGFGDIVIDAVDYVIITNFYAEEEADPSNVINEVNGRLSIDSKSYFRFGGIVYV